MTRTILFTTGNADANPMFVKLRDRFAYQGMTVGDVMRKKADQQGYGSKLPRKKPTPITTSSAAPEARFTVGNSLPHDRRNTVPDETMPLPAVKAGVGAQTAAHPIPFGTIAVLALCAMILMCLVYTGVRVNSLKRDINEMNQEVAQLQKLDEELSSKLIGKNDLTYFEDVARNELGMVKKSTVHRSYIAIDATDKAEAYQAKEDDNVILSGLLSAFGESIGK